MSVPTSSETGRVRAGMDAAGRGVQGELADRDGHPAGALVAEAEDPLVVGDDDEPDVVVRALAQELRDPPASAGVIQTPRVRRTMWLNSWHGPPDRRRVDDRQELLEVLGEQPVEERRVAVLERGQPDVALEGVVLAPEVLELELDLLLDGQDAVGQEAAQPEGVALGVGEGQVLGQQPAAEERRPRQRDRRRPAGSDASKGAGSGRIRRAYRRTTPAVGGRLGPRHRRPCRPSRTPRGPAGGRCTGTCPASSNVTVVSRVGPAGIVTSVGREPWTGSVPVRWRSWIAASPTIHSWSIGSSLCRTIVTGVAGRDRDLAGS